MLHTCSSKSSVLMTVVAVGLVLASCSGSAASSGEVVIEGKLADEIGLGELEATCNEPDALEVGGTFTCEATTTDGETIEFLGTMTAAEEFEVVSSNLLIASDLVAIQAEGARVLSDEIGATILPEDIDCGDGSVVLDDVGDLLCAITDTTTGDVFDLTVSTGGLVPGVGARELRFQVADEPR